MYLLTHRIKGIWTSEGMKSETRETLRSFSLSTSIPTMLLSVCLHYSYFLSLNFSCFLANILGTHSTKSLTYMLCNPRKSDLLAPIPSSYNELILEQYYAKTLVSLCLGPQPALEVFFFLVLFFYCNEAVLAHF